MTDPIMLHAFDGSTGEHLTAVPCSALSWSDSISDIGSMDVTLPDCPELRRLDVDRLLRPYDVIYAAKAGDRILHAGWLTRWRMTDDARSISLSVGGGWSILERRLVLDAALIDGWREGQVLIDEDNPPGDWTMTLTGTYRDIARGLIAETMRWGSLPYLLPDVDGGAAHERTYNSWDLSTVSQRLGDLADLADGPEIRFDPELADGRIRFRLRVGDPEIVDHKWTWNAGLPDARVMAGGLDADGGDMTGQAYAVGGRNDDKLLVTRATGTWLTSHGWPLLQSANTGHTTVAELATLHSYVMADVAFGDRPTVTVGVRCGLERDVRVGDHVDLRLPSDDLRLAALGRADGMLRLKVTDLSGSSGDDWLTMQTRLIDGFDGGVDGGES